MPRNFYVPRVPAKLAHPERLRVSGTVTLTRRRKRRRSGLGGALYAVGKFVVMVVVVTAAVALIATGIPLDMLAALISTTGVPGR